MRGAAGSTTQYHPYLQMDSRNVCSDQQAVSIAVPTTTKLELKMEHQQRLPTHITAADTTATPVSLMHTDATDVYDRSAKPPRYSSERDSTECDAPTSAQPPQGRWLQAYGQFPDAVSFGWISAGW